MSKKSNIKKILNLVETYQAENIELAFCLAQAVGFNLDHHLHKTYRRFFNCIGLFNKDLKICLAIFSNIFKDGRLNLSQMELEKIPKEILFINGIEHLVLERNEIKKLPSFLLDLPKLKTINVAHNEIETIDMKVLENFTRRGVNIYGLTDNPLTETCKHDLYDFYGNLLGFDNPLTINCIHYKHKSYYRKVGKVVKICNIKTIIGNGRGGSKIRKRQNSNNFYYYDDGFETTYQNRTHKFHQK